MMSSSSTGLLGLLMHPMPNAGSAVRNRIKADLAWHLTIALLINVLSLALPIMMLQVYDRIIPNQSYGTLTLLVAGVGAALVCEVLLRLARAQLISHTATQQEHEVGCLAMDRVIRADITQFEKETPATHLQNMMALGRLREFYSGQSLTALIDVPFALVFLGMIAVLGGMLVVVPLALLVSFFCAALFIGQRLKGALQNRSMRDDKKISFIVSVLGGIHTAKSFGMEALLAERFKPYLNDSTQASYTVARESAAAGTLSAVFGQLSLLLTATAGAFLVLDNQLSVGGLTACTLLAGRAIQPVQRVLGTWLRVQDLTVARAQAEALFTLPTHTYASIALPQPEGRLRVERASFSVGKRCILDQINLEVEPGEIIAITGTKGSGKTTLMHLMLGVISPESGKVRIDDTIDPAAYPMSDLKAHIGYMPQLGTIYRGTILDNLTGFDSGEAVIQRAMEAASILGLDRVIHQLPYGYKTMLGDTAADPVPPGIKQRIALTRVMVHDPAVLLFDDADRTLDKSGYNALFQYLGTCRGKKTVILASHDQNLTMLADRHYVLDRGKLKQNLGNVVFLNHAGSSLHGEAA